MKLVCSNRRWWRFDKDRAQGLETDHPGVPQFPLWVHASNYGGCVWSQGTPHQLLIHDWAIICTFLVNRWTFFIFGDIRKLQVVEMCKLLHVNSSILGMTSLDLSNDIHSSGHGFVKGKTLRWICKGKGLERDPFQTRDWRRAWLDFAWPWLDRFSIGCWLWAL